MSAGSLINFIGTQLLFQDLYNRTVLNFNLTRATQAFILIIGLIAGMYFAAAVLIPFIFAALLALLIKPLCDKLESSGLNRPLATSIGALIIFVVTGGLIVLLFYQISVFVDDVPQMQEELNSLAKGLKKWVHNQTGIRPEEQSDMVNKRSDALAKKAQSLGVNVLNHAFSFIAGYILCMIYLFLMLINRGRIFSLIMSYVPSERNSKGEQVIRRSSEVAHQYLWGRLKVMGALAVLYLITFLIFGVDYILLLIIFSVIVTVIPYIGALISGAIPVAVYLLSGESLSMVLLLAGVLFIIQMVESYLLEPYLLGREVHLSAFMVIIAIVIGGALWGVAGMILFVPIFAVLKIIFRAIPAMQPLANFMGD